MSAFSMEEAAAKIGKRVRRIVTCAGMTSIMIGTVIRADAVDEGYTVSVIWDPQERLFGDRFTKEEYGELLVEVT
jgi:hypothetical protein